MSSARERRGQRGLVVGLWRVAVDFFFADFFAVPLFAAGAGCFFVVRFFVAAVAVPVVAAAPDETRVECFWRWRTFVVAASAAVAAVNAASIATSSTFIVFRTIPSPPSAVRYFTPTVLLWIFLRIPTPPCAMRFTRP